MKHNQVMCMEGNKKPLQNGPSSTRGLKAPLGKFSEAVCRGWAWLRAQFEMSLQRWLRLGLCWHYAEPSRAGRVHTGLFPPGICPVLPAGPECSAAEWWREPAELVGQSGELQQKGLAAAAAAAAVHWSHSEMSFEWSGQSSNEDGAWVCY